MAENIKTYVYKAENIWHKKKTNPSKKTQIGNHLNTCKTNYLKRNQTN